MDGNFRDRQVEFYPNLGKSVPKFYFGGIFSNCEMYGVWKSYIASEARHVYIFSGPK